MAGMVERASRTRGAGSHMADLCSKAGLAARKTQLAHVPKTLTGRRDGGKIVMAWHPIAGKVLSLSPGKHICPLATKKKKLLLKILLLNLKSF